MFGYRIAYTLFMIAAMLVAGILVRYHQRFLPLDSRQKWMVAMGGLVGATLSARLPFVFDASQQTFSFWLGDGKTILWGLAGGYVGVEVAKWSISVRQSTGDTFVIPVAIAIAIGRLGCLFYGCCYGIPTDQSWGIRFPTAPDAGALMRHPTQLYELLFHAGFACTAWLALTNRRLRGNWMPLYVLAYSIYRLVSEFWRPEPRDWHGLTFFQWSAIVIGLAFAILLLARHQRGFTPIDQPRELV